eukprot:408283-Prymnesium_polylepis.2
MVRRKVRTADVRAVTDCMFLSLNITDLERVAESFPNIWTRIENAAGERVKAIARANKEKMAVDQCEEGNEKTRRKSLAEVATKVAATNSIVSIMRRLSRKHSVGASPASARVSPSDCGQQVSRTPCSPAKNDAPGVGNAEGSGTNGQGDAPVADASSHQHAEKNGGRALATSPASNEPSSQTLDEVLAK